MEQPRGARLLHQLLVLYQRVALYCDKYFYCDKYPIVLGRCSACCLHSNSQFGKWAIGLSALNHGVQRSTLDEQFHGLIVSLTRTQIAAKNGLEVERDGFSNRTTMIAGVLLPAFVSMLADRAQLLIPWVRLSAAIAMLPNLGTLARGITALAPLASISSSQWLWS